MDIYRDREPSLQGAQTRSVTEEEGESEIKICMHGERG